jgi:type IV secretion system protein VirB11
MAHYLGPARRFLSDEEVTEIYTSPLDGRVFLDTREGGRVGTELHLSPGDIRSFLNVVADRQAETLGPGNESIQAQLPKAIFGGARLQGILPRIVRIPCLNIRKRPTRIYTLADYVAQGALTPGLKRSLEEAVARRKNILVAGGTGSGKTTFVNAVLKAMTDHGPRENFLLIEDTPELQCAAEDRREFQTTLHSRMVDLVRMSLRASPDRIIVGEVRDGSAYYLMDAWCTGHPGGAGTVHATSPAGALRRMARLARQAHDVDHRVLVAESIDLVCVIRKSAGKRKVTDVVQVSSELLPSDAYALTPLFSSGDGPTGSGRGEKRRPSPMKTKGGAQGLRSAPEEVPTSQVPPTQVPTTHS